MSTQKYTTKQLEDILKGYLRERKDKASIITQTGLANYAKKRGFEKVKYYDFGRNDTIKQLILKKNEELGFNLDCSSLNVYSLEFNALNIMEKNYGNKMRMLNVLRGIEKSIKNIVDEGNSKELENRKFKLEMKELMEEKDITIKKQKELSDENDRLRYLLKKMTDVIDEENNKELLEVLAGYGLISSLGLNPYGKRIAEPHSTNIVEFFKRV